MPTAIRTTDNTPLLGLAAYSGTGKTTLLEQLILRLKSEGLKLALIKHSHHDIELDQPDKDSYRLRHAGCVETVLATPGRSIHFIERPIVQDTLLEEQLALLSQKLDLVLVEGFRHQPFPKIELRRKGMSRPLLCLNDPTIIAIACDYPINEAPPSLPRLNINDPEQIAYFILQWLKKTDEASPTR